MEYWSRTTLEILQETQKNLDDRQINPEHFGGRITFMSTFNDIDWTMKGNAKICPWNSEQVKKLRKKVSATLVILSPGDEDKWYGTHTYKPEGKRKTCWELQGNWTPSFPRYQCVEWRY